MRLASAGTAIDDLPLLGVQQGEQAVILHEHLVGCEHGQLVGMYRQNLVREDGCI
jgi:hypothetical protein